MVIIRQLGCWRLLLQHRKYPLGLILPKYTRIQKCLGKKSISCHVIMLYLCFSYWFLYLNIWIIRKNKALIKELSSPAPDSKDLYFPTRYSQSFFTQCMACLWKQCVSYWRHPQYTAVRLIFTAMMAVLLGSFFWDLGSKRYTCNILTRNHFFLKFCDAMYVKLNAQE